MNKQAPKPHIAYLITRTEVGGAQTHLYELLRHNYKNSRLCLISGEDDWLADKARELSIDVIIIASLTNSLSPLKNLLCFFQLRKVLNNLKPDLLHIHSSKAGILGRLASIGLGHKTLFTAHGWAFGKDKPKLRHFIALTSEKLCAPFSDAIITVSNYDLELAKQANFHKHTPCFMIHNGVDDVDQSLVSKKTGNDGGLGYQNDNEEVVITTLARLAKPKDIFALINAIAILNKLNAVGKTKRSRLLIIGDGPDKDQLMALSEKLSTDNVIFLGQKDNVAELLSTCNIFVLISNWEGLPISVIEAMRAGLPIVASDVGGLSEQVTDNLNGYLLTNNDPSQIAEKLQPLINDKSLRDTFSKASRNDYLARFHVKLMIDKTNAVYRNLIYNDPSIDNTITKDKYYEG